MRAGYRARWRGQEYEAWPAPTPQGLWVRLYTDGPAAGFDRIRDDRYRRVVLASDVEELVYLRPVALWRGEPCLVRGRRGGWVDIEYTGGNAAVAERLGLIAVERGVYRGRVPGDELTDVHLSSTPIPLA